jgi:hypothetical protein
VVIVNMKQRWDFFVKHSDDEAREARYLHRTWRKPDGGFYVGVDPPENSKALGIVCSIRRLLRKYMLTTLAVLSSGGYSWWMRHA